MEKVTNKKINITIKLGVIAVLLVAILLYLFSFKLKPLQVEAKDDLITFNREGFMDASGLNNTEKLVSQNENFELYLDETTSYFEVHDKRNGHVWKSNPTVNDPWQEIPGKNITNAALNNQKSTLQIQYFDQEGTRVDLNNYRFSIYHPESIIEPEGVRTFQIKYISNGFQILYLIEDQEIDHLYFPKFIDKEVFEAYDSKDLAILTNIYNFEQKHNAYYLSDSNYEGNMTRIIKKTLFDIFYHQDGSSKEEYGFDRDSVIELNAQYGYYDSYEKLSFEIAIQVLLTEEGFDASIIKDSLVEKGAYKFASITFLPLLGTASSEEDGYLVIPDGSGAILNFNNEKEMYSPYRKRVYGSDLALLNFKQPEEQESIRIPVYGMIKENAGFAAIITEGDAQVSLNADTSNRVDSYNKIYPTFHVRENELITLGTGFTTHSLNLWTQNIVDSDLTISYRLLTDDQNNYVGIANAYRDYLVEEFGFKKNEKNYSNMVLELLGAYDERAFFLGFKYSKKGTMTTFNQALEIVELLDSKGVDLDVIYRGALDGGIRNKVQTKSKIDRKLGGKKGYESLEKKLALLNSNLYLQVNIARAQSYNRLFDNYTYTASRLNGSLARFFTYHEPSGLPYSETRYEHSADDYVINPLYYQTIYNKFNKNSVANNIAHINLGHVLTGHYKKGQEFYKQDTLNLQKQLFESTKESMLFYNPLGFAYLYADYAVDLPTNTTHYSIIDDHIPLLQLVLSGYVPYTSRSLNLNNKRSEQHNFLKLIETGSRMKYTLTHDDPKKLINTEYNEFLATYYVNWITPIVKYAEELEGLKIYEGSLINHEIIARDVYKVTYSNGLEIYINYRLTTPFVTPCGKTVKPLDYEITKEA